MIEKLKRLLIYKLIRIIEKQNFKVWAGTINFKIGISKGRIPKLFCISKLYLHEPISRNQEKLKELIFSLRREGYSTTGVYRNNDIKGSPILVIVKKNNKEV